MSTWQARRYYSSDEQSQIIAKLIQKSILAAAETTKVQDDLIQLGDLSDSSLNMTEFIAAKLASAFTVWKLPIEPDNSQCRLWLHATNCCMLSDLSDFGALAKFYGRYPKLVLGYDDGVTGNVMNPYMDGITNYLRISDNPNIRLNNIVATRAGITIFFRAYTTSLSLSLDGSKRFFFSKIDDDLVTYGYEAFADPAGVIYFVVRQNGIDYKNKTASPALTQQRDYSDFDSADYKAVDFYTTAQPVYSPMDLVDDYVFTFKFSDHSMQIFKNGVSLTLASASAEPSVFPPAISNPPPLNNANLLTVTMTASGGTNVAFSNDANLTTRWEQLSLPAYLVADMGQIKTVGYVQIAWYRGSLGRIQTFQILISDDNVTYVSVFSGQGLGTDVLQRYDFPDATGRYVKLLITANSEGASASVYEFQVWGFDPITVVYAIDTLYSVPITGGDYIDLYSTPVGSSTDPIFGVTGTTSTDTQIKYSALIVTAYSATAGTSTIVQLDGTTNDVGGAYAVVDGSVLNGKVVYRITMYLWRVGSGSGTVKGFLRGADGFTFIYSTNSISVGSIVAGAYNPYIFTFSDNVFVSHNAGFLAGIQCQSFTGGVKVNIEAYGPPSAGTSDSTNTCAAYGTPSSLNYITGHTDWDMHMIVETVTGNQNPICSAGEYIADNTSVLFGKIIVKVTFKLAKVGAPTGNITCFILLAGGSSVTSTTTISAASLPVSTGSNYVATDFLFSANAHVGATGDTIYVFFNGGDPSNYVVVQREVGSASGDGVHTTLATQTKDTTWTYTTTDDSACTIYVTNIIPASTQNRVAMNCAGDFGTFVNHVINDFTFYLKKLGVPTGTIYFRIRDINDAIVQDLGNFSAASLTTSNTTIHFVNIATFLHRMVKGDKICVEYTSVTGVSTDRVQVQQNDRTWFGDPDTNEQSYNNISYSTVSNRVFAGIYKEGGQTVIFQAIDLQSQDITVQPGYSHDLFLFACLEFEQLSQTWTLKQGFWKGIFSQFRIYYDLLTLTQIQNLYANKISISNISYGQVLTGGDIMNLQP